MRKLLDFLVSNGASVRAPVTSAGAHDGVSGWQEDYLLAHSDIDAMWYYERRRWRSQA